LQTKSYSRAVWEYYYKKGRAVWDICHVQFGGQTYILFPIIIYLYRRLFFKKFLKKKEKFKHGGGGSFYNFEKG
jgi:hypothetical protein